MESDGETSLTSVVQSFGDPSACGGGGVPPTDLGSNLDANSVSQWTQLPQQPQTTSSNSILAAATAESATPENNPAVQPWFRGDATTVTTTMAAPVPSSLGKAPSPYPGPADTRMSASSQDGSVSGFGVGAGTGAAVDHLMQWWHSSNEGLLQPCFRVDCTALQTSLATAMDCINDLRSRLKILEGNQRVLEENQTLLQTENQKLAQRLAKLEASGGSVAGTPAARAPSPQGQMSAISPVSAAAPTASQAAPPVPPATTTTSGSSASITAQLLSRSADPTGRFDRLPIPASELASITGTTPPAPLAPAPVVVSSSSASLTKPKGMPVVGLEIADGDNGEGVLIVNVKPTGPCAGAGFAANDRILTFNSIRVRSREDFKYAVMTSIPGQTVEVSYRKPDSSQIEYTTVTLREASSVYENLSAPRSSTPTSQPQVTPAPSPPPVATVPLVSAPAPILYGGVPTAQPAPPALVGSSGVYVPLTADGIQPVGIPSSVHGTPYRSEGGVYSAHASPATTLRMGGPPSSVTGTPSGPIAAGVGGYGTGSGASLGHSVAQRIVY